MARSWSQGDTGSRRCRCSGKPAAPIRPEWISRGRAALRAAFSSRRIHGLLPAAVLASRGADRSLLGDDSRWPPGLARLLHAGWSRHARLRRNRTRTAFLGVHHACIPRPGTGRHHLPTTRRSTGSVTASRTHSADRRTGEAWRPATIDAHTPSFRQSASRQPSHSGCRDES